MIVMVVVIDAKIIVMVVMTMVIMMVTIRLYVPKPWYCDGDNNGGCVD